MGTIILGVDPGLASTGVAVVQGDAAGRWRLLESGTVLTRPSQPMPERLAAIHALVAGMLSRHHPDAMVLEAVFLGKNAKSTVLMAHGRGVALLAAAAERTPVREYSAAEVKVAVVGKGRATKAQVGLLVSKLLGLEEPPASEHEADAMAVALCHGFRAGMAALRERVLSRAAGTPASARQEANRDLLAQASRRRGRRGRR